MTYGGGSAASSMKIYVDGAQVTTSAPVDNLTSTLVNSVNFLLGGRADGFYYPGQLDEVAVYTKALTLSEVQWVYNSGVPRSLLGVGSPSDLEAYWLMGEGVGTPLNGTMMFMEAGDIVSESLAGYGGSLFERPRMNSATRGGFGGRLLDISGGTVVVLYYKMRAQDSGASPPGYVTWVSSGSPDFSGVGYAGGTPTPVGAMVAGSVVVAAEWSEP
jgi:hypothetical protein